VSHRAAADDDSDVTRGQRYPTADAIASAHRIAEASARLPGGAALLGLLEERLAAAEARRIREDRIVEALMPALTTLSEAALTQLRWNATTREQALDEVGALTAAQLADLRGSTTSNPHVTTGRWLASGTVFAIDTPDGRRFPAFQFTEGRPKPAITRVLQALGGRLQGWEALGWFTGSNGYLGGARPIDLVDDDPGAVAFAAEQVGGEAYG
jgi:hypothetical protein